KNITEGHIFHVITHGKGLMWAHGSQISPEDRWTFAKYVKALQKYFLTTTLIYNVSSYNSRIGTIHL
ncbi:MAG: c-type cytochrome, partial [Chryseotalea sp.]